MFVDEAKSGGLVVVAVVTGPTGLGAGRALLRGLLLPGQTHLHFTKERDNRRREIVTAVAGLDIRIDVYDASGADPRTARDHTMELVVADLVRARAAWLVIERDESLEAAERRLLAHLVRRHGAEATLEYRHVPKRNEPLLWAADAAAWCWTHKGWRDRLRSRIGSVTTVE